MRKTTEARTRKACAGALGALLVAITAGACTSRPNRPTVEAMGTGGTNTTSGGASNMTNATGGMGTGGSGVGGSGVGGSGVGGMMVVGQDDATCMAFTPPRTMKLTPEDPIVAEKMGQLNQSQMIELMHGGTGTPTWDQSSFTGNGVQAAGIP